MDNFANRIKLSVFMVGFTTISTSIVFLRSLFSLNYGFEITIGIGLCCLFFGMTIGALIGQFIRFSSRHQGLIVRLHLFLGFLPILDYFLLNAYRSIIFPLGPGVEIFKIIGIALVVLWPLGLTSGLSLVKYSTSYSSTMNYNFTNVIYGIWSIGGLSGGLLFNVVLIFFIESLGILKGLMILNIGIAVFLFILPSNIRYPWTVGVFSLIIVGALLFLETDSVVFDQHSKNPKIIDQEQSRFGTLFVTKTAGQYKFYQNNLLFSTSDQKFKSEENVHFAMLQHSNPQNILVIGGNQKEILQEVKKYPISSIDYLELDPSLLSVAEKYFSIQSKDKKVNLVKQDPRSYLTRIDKIYDVILINLPDPENILINRYYTLEFFEEIKKNLSFSGILSISLSGNSEYLSEESNLHHASLYSTLKLIFSDVIIIPGQRNYFLASEMPLSFEISKLLKSKEIFNTFMHPDYLDDRKFIQYEDKIDEVVGNKVIINYDFYPSIFRIKFHTWFKGKTHFIYILLALIILTYIFIGKNDAIDMGLITTGFSTSSLVFFLVMVFQAIYGYIFFMLGIFVSVYLTGLTIASLSLSKRIQKTYRNFSLIQYLLGIFSITIPLVFLRLYGISSSGFILQTMFIVFILCLGILSGLQFVMASSLRLVSIEKSTKRTYGFDMAGSAIGYLIIPILLIPILGYIRVCLVIGILNFITGLWLLIRMKLNVKN